MNFDIHSWLDGTPTDCPLNTVVPKRIDTYRRGHLTMGCKVERGLAIQAARGRKQHEANKRHFMAEVLPMIEDQLDLESWQQIAYAFYDLHHEIMRRAGFVLYALDVRQSWIHPVHEPDKIEAAKKMGASAIQ
jgi:hypothetical protein